MIETTRRKYIFDEKFLECLINFHAELKDQMLEKETELSSAKKELTELEQYQVGYPHH